MVQEPAPVRETVLPETVQLPLAVKLTARPEVALALIANIGSPKVRSFSDPKSIVWSALIGAGTAIRPILFAPFSLNHRAPSGPAVMAPGPLPAVGRANSVMTPAVVIRPIWFA